MSNENTPIGILSVTAGSALWCDLATDRERAEFLRDGRAHSTGIVAATIQDELADAFEALASIRELCTTDHESKEAFISRVLFSLPNETRSATDTRHV